MDPTTMSMTSPQQQQQQQHCPWINLGEQTWLALRHEWLSGSSSSSSSDSSSSSSSSSVRRTTMTTTATSTTTTSSRRGGGGHVGGRTERRTRRMDPELIYAELTKTKGKLSQPIPLEDVVNVLTWAWESDPTGW